MVRNLANPRYLGMQTNLASHVNQDVRRIARKDFVVDDNRREWNPETHSMSRKSRLDGAGFNHDLIRIKRAMARLSNMQCSFRTLDLILIADFSFNRTIATVVNSRNWWKLSREPLVTRVWNYFTILISHTGMGFVQIYSSCYTCVIGARVTAKWRAYNIALSRKISEQRIYVWCVSRDWPTYTVSVQYWHNAEMFYYGALYRDTMYV